MASATEVLISDISARDFSELEVFALEECELEVCVWNCDEDWCRCKIMERLVMVRIMSGTR